MTSVIGGWIHSRRKMPKLVDSLLRLRLRSERRKTEADS
jgi:hypothetical protein